MARAKLWAHGRAWLRTANAGCLFLLSADHEDEYRERDGNRDEPADHLHGSPEGQIPVIHAQRSSVFRIAR
jgi:hypothetical protein